MDVHREGKRAGGTVSRQAWWALAARGVVAIAIGMVMLMRPGMTLAVLLGTIGVYLFLDGVLALAAAFSAARGERTWRPYILEGLLSMGVGVLAFMRPSLTAVAVLVVVAARAIF